MLDPVLEDTYSNIYGESLTENSYNGFQVFNLIIFEKLRPNSNKKQYNYKYKKPKL